MILLPQSYNFIYITYLNIFPFSILYSFLIFFILTCFFFLLPFFHLFSISILPQITLNLTEC